VKRIVELLVPTSGQRLFVLNVCDAGFASPTGFLPKLGIASLISGPNQATISHRWAVEGLVARIFGARLAMCLAEGQDYFPSFVDLILVAIAERQTGGKNKTIDPGLANAVYFSTIEFEPLVRYGFPMFKV
jgi:hypothetical protein